MKREMDNIIIIGDFAFLGICFTARLLVMGHTVTIADKEDGKKYHHSRLIGLLRTFASQAYDYCCHLCYYGWGDGVFRRFPYVGRRYLFQHQFFKYRRNI
jgi:hypothetical protein